MARSTSTTFNSAAFALDCGEVFVVLLMVDHAALAQPIRVTSNNEQTSMGGNTFEPYPFEMQLLSDSEGKVSAAKLRIDNVSRVLTDAVRTPTTPPDVTYWVVLASDPNTIEVGPVSLKLGEVTITRDSVSGTLTPALVMNRPFPPERMTPGTTPGVFA